MAHYRKITIEDETYEWCATSCGGFYVKGVGKHPFEKFGYTDADFDYELGYPSFGPSEVANFIKSIL